MDSFSIENARMTSNSRTSSRKSWVIIICVVLVLTAVVLTLSIYFGFLPAHDKESGGTKNVTAEELWSSIWLPRDCKPSTYDIILDVDMKKEMYQGTVTIRFDVIEDTDLVVFHKKNLDILETELSSDKKGEHLQIETQLYNNVLEQQILKLKSNMSKGSSYKLTLTIENKLYSQLHGFYMSKYKDSSNRTHKTAMTFFSPVSARMAIPCFDEPNMKANFTLTISNQKEYHALANMPAKKTIQSKDKVTTYFEPSIKMSTYILCWVVSDFVSRNLTTSSKQLIKAWATKEEVHFTEYGINITARLLHHYENYFGIPFPLKKLDVVALPEFGPNAMENWGLITYRKARFLYDAEKTPITLKQMMLITVAHEMAHQWFGNLATMDYWTDAWLKEGKIGHKNIYQ